MLNRENIHNYREFYIKVSMETLLKRDQKGLYSGTMAEKEKEVTGVHVEIEKPKHPDLVLENNGEKMPEEQVGRILAC